MYSKCHHVVSVKKYRENSDHLYFECSFTKRVWQVVKDFVGSQVPNSEWEALIKESRNNSLQGTIVKVFASATVSHLWAEIKN